MRSTTSSARRGSRTPCSGCSVPSPKLRCTHACWPKAGSTSQGLNVNVFQTLMARSLDEPFTLYGLLAESIETDAARSFVTFRLNPLARFSDGHALTTEDVLFTFDLLRTKGRPLYRSAFNQVKSVKIIGTRIVGAAISQGICPCSVATSSACPTRSSPWYFSRIAF